MSEFAFDGFEPANTTPVPDVLFDELLSALSGAELKVMLYVIRRTLGFKKSTDAISLSQFEKGIVTGEGKILDKGCGLNRETICKALKSLEIKGCIKCQKRNARHNDKDITLYSIRFKGDGEVVGKSDQLPSRKSELPLVGKVNYGSRKTSTEVVGKSDLQETVIQYTDSQETVIQENTENASNDALPRALVFHPEHSFIGFDDLLAPSLMVVRLTPNFPSRYWSEMEDKRRHAIVDEVMRYLQQRGIKVTIKWEYETEQEIEQILNENEKRSQRVAPMDDVDNTTTTHPTQEDITPQPSHNAVGLATDTPTVLKASVNGTLPKIEAESEIGASPIALETTSEQPKGKRKPKSVNPAQVARRKRVYEVFDTLAKEVTGEEFHYQHSGNIDKAIDAWLENNPTEGTLREVYLKLANMPPDPKTGFTWADNMSIEAVIRQHDKIMLAKKIQEKRLADRHVVTAAMAAVRQSPYVAPQPVEDELPWIGPQSRRNRRRA